MPSVLLAGRLVLWRVIDILLPRQEQDGFAVWEDEHCVYVKQFEKVCFVFSSSAATRESIRAAVERLRTSDSARP